MDNMAYLNQISASNRPAKKSGLDLPFSPKILIGLGIAVLTTILIIIIGSIAGGNSNKDVKIVENINLRTTNLIKTIGDYNKQVKSSELRSMGSSLSTVLNETNKKTNTLITDIFKTKLDNKGSLANDETAHIEETNTILENARLNGLLDRNYARQMTLEIALLMSLETDGIDRTKKSEVKDVLSSSYSNLESLHKQFSEYSEKAK